VPHTPGPYKHHHDHGRYWISAGKGKKAIHIADVADIEVGVGSGEVDTDQETTAANAALLVAAPILLSACQHALHTLGIAQDDAINEGGRESEMVKSFDEPLKLLRKAIALALKK
jgi:hypothetical protein